MDSIVLASIIILWSAVNDETRNGDGSSRLYSPLQLNNLKWRVVIGNASSMSAKRNCRKPELP